MRLKITHRTEYSYDLPLSYALQRIRLVPQTTPAQAVKSWRLSISGAREELGFIDHFGNDTRLLSVEGDPHVIAIEASGEIETKDCAGITGAHSGFAPLWLFQHETPLTAVGQGIAALAASVPKGTDIERLHSLMAIVRDRVAYRPGTTDAATTAEAALGKESGVCQDHTHIFVAASRRLGFPARYISGYLLIDGAVDQAATHAWAEAHVQGLGWVAFDAANGTTPDDRYACVATGRDYRDAMPVSGIRLGQADEILAVHITVEQ